MLNLWVWSLFSHLTKIIKGRCVWPAVNSILLHYWCHTWHGGWVQPKINKIHNQNKINICINFTECAVLESLWGRWSDSCPWSNQEWKSWCELANERKPLSCRLHLWNQNPQECMVVKPWVCKSLLNHFHAGMHTFVYSCCAWTWAGGGGAAAQWS